MTVYDLIWELDKITCIDGVLDPEVFIQIGDIQAPIVGIKYFPEVDGVVGESVVIGSVEEPKLIL